MKKTFFLAVAAVALMTAACCPQDAPVIPDTPVISNITFENITSTSVQPGFDLDRAATLYVLPLLSGAATPKAADIKASGDAFGLPAGNGMAIAVGLLTPDTNYKLHMVAENANGFGPVVSVTFKTLP